MRVSASKADSEIITFEAPPEKARTRIVKVISCEHMVKPAIAGHLLGLAVVAPKIALLTFEGLWIAEVCVESQFGAVARSAGEIRPAQRVGLCE
jgi:hypothetical protein